MEVHPGDCLGRYTVRALIGSGRTGRVFAAFDAELGRNVAVKLFPPDARLLGEARALARLHHPNVVGVHDVGTERDQIFVAMDLVEGPTLAEWLRAGEHGWRAVRDAFVAAGCGLAAAHAAAIVHRQFTAHDAIVGKEGVVVVDFGLARARDDEPDPDQGDHGDQLAFCVALRDALSDRNGVPAWVTAAVTRGLAPDPAARWPSIPTLVDALTRDPGVARRRVLAAVGVVALGAAAVWGVARPAATNVCGGATARLAGTWAASQKDAIGAAFAATRLPYAEDAWHRVRAQIDDYAARWVDMSGEACRRTRVDRRQSDAVMDLRMECLERRRAVLAALTELWARGMQPQAVETALDAAQQLAPLDECADARALAERAPLPSNPARVATIVAARARIDVVRALTLASRYPEARKAAIGVRVLADASGWPQVRAEVAWAEGNLLNSVSDPGAEPLLLDAFRLAGEAHDHRLAARALVDLVGHLGRTQKSAGRALLVADIAEGVVGRAGDVDQARVGLLQNRGSALSIGGKYDAAWATLTTAHERATAVFGAGSREALAVVSKLAGVARDRGDYALARRLGEENLAATIAMFGGEHPRVASNLNGLAISVKDAGEYETAAEYFRRALAIVEKAAGPNTERTANALVNLGNMEILLGNIDEAQALLERALAIREGLLGREHIHVAMALNNLAAVRRKQGRYQEALDLVERSLAINTKVHGPTHPDLAYPLSSIGEVLQAKGDLPGALGYYQHAVDLRRKALRPDHPLTLEVLTQVARVLALLGRCAEARPLLATAIAGLEKELGADHADVAEALAVGARCDLAAGRAAPAVASLERAVTIREKTKGAALDRGQTRWLLARALWSSDRREAAVAAAEKAEQELAADPEGARDRAAARAWLAARAQR